MSDDKLRQKLALEGGLKAVGTLQGRGSPKIGREEFLAVAARFGFSERTLAKIRDAVAEEDLGAGPFLANYYSGLEETCVQRFERVAREIFGTKYAIGVSSGTAALHSAFVAAGVGPGTEVICPAIGFFATAAAVVQAKGIPVFCDVDESLGMDAADAETRITNRTVALAPTHVMGSVCDMAAIMALAEKHSLRVIEDCAQSCGGLFHGRRVGTFGDLGCFSISAYKIVGGGEGGLIVTDQERLWDRANGVAECGGLWRPVRFDPPRYPGELFCGTNYRMSELEAAVDAVQLGKMPETTLRFRNVKMRILRQLKSFAEITPQKLNDPAGEVGYNLRFFPESTELGARIVEALRAEGVGAGMTGSGPNWHIYADMFPITMKSGATSDNCPYECPIYKERGGDIHYAKGDCPKADDLFQRLVSVSLNQWFSAEDCDHIAEGINKVLSAYCSESADAPDWWPAD